MNAADTLEIARNLWPDATVVLHSEDDDHGGKVAWVSLDGHGKPKETHYNWSPSESLDDMALAFPVLEKRGLLDYYAATLAGVADFNVTHCWKDYAAFATATAHQQSLALLAVVRANPLESEENK